MANPAEQASNECLEKVIKTLKEGKCFRLEAGAGAGKTYTLIKALEYLIRVNANLFIKSNKKIACITYTHVAKDEIQSKIDNNPVVCVETIHAFCWSLIKDFQKTIRSFIPNLTDQWKERCATVDNLGNRKVTYNLGYPKLTETEIFLHHDDVIRIMTQLISDSKFRMILKNRFPIIFIDEYQDTNKILAQAIVQYLVETENGPIIGFFGDHWQTIYGSSSCGLISVSEEKMEVIGKNANFRSDRLIVEGLNRIRPDLIQQFHDPESTGEILIFDSNNWTGERRTEAHWKGDLPEQEAHKYLEMVYTKLQELGWSFQPESTTTKILMLTNQGLASEQGYQKLLSVFSRPDDLLKKTDPYISFLIDTIEPGAEAFMAGRFGEMFRYFNLQSPSISKHSDKEDWNRDMNKLIEVRDGGTIGDVLDLLKSTKRPRLPVKVDEKERLFLSLRQKPESDTSDKEKEMITRNTNMRAIPYSELIKLGKYIDDKTLFSTKHGVKGAQFDNVLVILGRGWNQYNWNQMLEWATNGIPLGKEDSFERNRNLFYVACSRPKKRLAMLFTQELTDTARKTLVDWFACEIQSL